MKEKVIVVLEQEALIELERILVDKDKEQALAFLKKYIVPPVHREEHGHCGCSTH